MAQNVNFKKIAQDEISLSPLMSGREKLDTDDILGKTATVIAFDFATVTDKNVEKTFAVVNFAEFPNHYYNGGTLMTKMCSAWANAFDGDVEEASYALAEQGGVKLHFSASRTKSGNNLTSITVVD